MLWSRKRERVLFTTVDPPSRRPEWAPGRLCDHEGRVYRITRWTEARPVFLKRGGVVGQWQLWGRLVSAGELRAEVEGAAERLLAEAAPPEEG